MKIAKPITIFLVSVSAAWIGWAFLVSRVDIPFFTKVQNMDTRGQFGDSFGALNALLTAFTFGGLAFSIYLQVKESEKRDRQDEDRRFDDHFFNLTNSLRSLVQATSVPGRDYATTGRAAFEVILKEVIKRRDQPFSVGNRSLENTITAYEHVFEMRQPHLGPYFRLLYRICRYIDSANVSEQKKADYMKILRAELSSTELALMALGTQTKRGEKFLPLIGTYSLLKHLPSDTIGKEAYTDLKQRIEATAFVEWEDIVTSAVDDVSVRIDDVDTPIDGRPSQ